MAEETHDDDDQRQMRDLNEALLISSVRQHELADQAQQAEVTARAGEDRYRALYEMAQLAEAAARESEERFRVLADNISQFAWTADANGSIYWYNRRWYDYTGTTPDETLADGWKQVHHPDHLDRVMRSIQRALDTGQVWEDTFPLRGKNGEFRWFLSRSVPVRDASGCIVRWFGTNTDIHDIKLAEEATSQLAAIVEFSDDAIISKDLQGVIATWNRGAQHLFGYSAEEAVGQPVTLLIPPDHLDEEPQILERIRRGDVVDHYETVRRRKDGSLVDVSLTVSPIRDAAGRIVGASKIARDISHGKLAEQALRESEERFRMLADNMSQFAWTADATGWIYWYNQRWYDYTGTTLDEMQGWGWKQVHHPDHVQRVVERLQRSWDTGELWEDTFPLRGKDGEYRWFLSRARPIRDAAGNVLRWFGTNTDVTEQRELENQIKQQAQALADLNRRKDEFLAMLSHELRNPLAPIRNAVQLLRLEQGGSEMQKEAHGMIERQVSHLARLVDDLLEVSRISTGRIHLQEHRIDFRGIVESAIEVTSSQCGQKGHTVAISLPGKPLWVYGDPVRLEQVVVNLLNNACKYTDRGGHFWIELKLQGHEAELRIRDNGVGIAPELLPRIFDLFTQADQSLDRAQGGLGIGLALVQSLVTMHRGRVEARSALGQGSEFIVWLPVMSATQAPSQVPAETVNRSDHSLKVLVVDDNVDAARGIALLLRVSGHNVRVAHEGAAAMQAALEYVPDVVLLDIGLPVINGYQVAQWIRQELTLQNVMLVALTGYGQESDRRLSQAAGFQHHLVKPVDFSNVQTILAAVANNLPKSAPTR